MKRKYRKERLKMKQRRATEMYKIVQEVIERERTYFYTDKVV
jgi:hypothetical protein